MLLDEGALMAYHGNGLSREAVLARRARILESLVSDLLDAIDEFGYEAVYIGVCWQVFPEAVNPQESAEELSQPVWAQQVPGGLAPCDRMQPQRAGREHAAS
jgi:hypothetical protein